MQVVRMANAAQSRATGPLFFLKTGCLNEILVASGNRATGQPGMANFEHCNISEYTCSLYDLVCSVVILT